MAFTIPIESDGNSSKRTGFTIPATDVSSIDASLPTTKSTFTGDAALLHKIGADEPGYVYGDILPTKKNVKTGEVSAAVPEMIRSPIRGLGDLISQAQNKSDETSPDAVGAMLAMLPSAKPVAKATTAIAEKAAGGVRNAVNAVSDAMATKVPVDKEHKLIINTLKEAGHSDKEIADILDKARNFDMTVGEASNNPKLLGMERKISGLNKPGGETIRDFVKDRVDPNNNVSIPFKLKTIADPLAEKVDAASKEIGNIVDKAPKSPLNSSSIEKALAKEPRPPKSSVTNTLSRIDGLVEWAKEQGNNFAAWHRVKQEIWNLRGEAKNPNAIEKLDTATINSYYSKINDLLKGKTAGLPEDLRQTGVHYAWANNAFHTHLAGRTIQDILDSMPTGGTPASALKYLYKNLAGNKESQDELFASMPEADRPHMMKFLEAIKDSSRSSVNDVVKSMEEGTPSFPSGWKAFTGQIKDKMVDAIRRRDYDALAKALTSPDAEKIAKSLGQMKLTIPKEKPVLRLTHQPEEKETDIFVNRQGEGIEGNEKIQSIADQIRERAKSLGISPDILRAQDLNKIRELETKYGASELGDFMIAHKDEPIMSKMWEIPYTEYDKSVVDKMLNDTRYPKLDNVTKKELDSQIKTAWNSHQFITADIVLAAREAVLEAAKIKGTPMKNTAIPDELVKAFSVKGDEIPSSIGMSFKDLLNKQ